MKNIQQIINSYESDSVKVFELENGSIERKMFNEEKVRAMLSEYASQLTGQRWISVEEKLPERGQEVLVFNPSDDLNTDYCYVDFMVMTDHLTWDYNEDNVTHWQPLPTPPQSK